MSEPKPRGRPTGSRDTSPRALTVARIRTYADSITIRCRDMSRDRELHVRLVDGQFVPTSHPRGVPAAPGCRKFAPMTGHAAIYQALYELAGGPAVAAVRIRMGA